MADIKSKSQLKRTLRPTQAPFEPKEPRRSRAPRPAGAPDFTPASDAYATPSRDARNAAPALRAQTAVQAATLLVLGSHLVHAQAARPYSFVCGIGTSRACGLSAADLAPAPADLPPLPDAIAATPLKMCPGQLPMLSMQVGDGQVDMLVDTGSSAAVVAEGSYEASATAVPLEGFVQITYGSGSSNGTVSLDSLRVPGAPPVRTTILSAGADGTEPPLTDDGLGLVPRRCPGDADSTFYGGILGVGPEREALDGTPTFRQGLVPPQGKAGVLALALCSTQGALYFGGYDASVLAEPLTFFRTLGDAPTHYTTLAADLRLGNATLLPPSGGMTLTWDSGSNVVTLPSVPYLEFVRRMAATGWAPPTAEKLGIYCAPPGASLRSLDEDLPSMTASLSSVGGPGEARHYTVPPSRYTAPLNATCRTVMVMETPEGLRDTSAGIFGTPGLDGNMVVHIPDSALLGVAPLKAGFCDEAT